MTDITDELREWVMRNIANSPAPTGSNANTDASSGNALIKKGGGRALEGGAKRARATAQQGEEARAPMGMGKGRGTKAPPVGGQGDGARSPGVVTTTRKGINLRIYRVVPLLAVVVDGEGEH